MFINYYNFNFCWVNSSHVISSCCLLYNMGMNCILYQELTKKTAVIELVKN